MDQKINVLMVDDEAQFRATTSKILNKRGFHTTMAADGEEAIRILKTNPQDVVVLDIMMPGMDGHQALAKIKEMAPYTQVIMLTGHGGLDSAKSSLKQGAYDYLTKPCDIDLLASKINSAFEALHGKKDTMEKRAEDIMILIEDYTTVGMDETVKEAIRKLKSSFQARAASSRVMETGHRSILVFDQNRELAGIVSILDLLESHPAGLFIRPKTLHGGQYAILHHVLVRSFYPPYAGIGEKKSKGNHVGIPPQHIGGCQSHGSGRTHVQRKSQKTRRDKAKSGGRHYSGAGSFLRNFQYSGKHFLMKAKSATGLT